MLTTPSPFQCPDCRICCTVGDAVVCRMSQCSSESRSSADLHTLVIAFVCLTMPQLCADQRDSSGVSSRRHVSRRQFLRSQVVRLTWRRSATGQHLSGLHCYAQDRTSVVSAHHYCSCLRYEEGVHKVRYGTSFSTCVLYLLPFALKASAGTCSCAARNGGDFQVYARRLR